MIPFSLLLLVLFATPSNGRALDSLMEEVTAKELRNECTYTTSASIQITDKIEGKTVSEVLEMKKSLEHDNLLINPSKCCLSNLGESYLFVTVENLKSGSGTFKGWIFSKHISLNGIEDPKFDLTLLKCF